MPKEILNIIYEDENILVADKPAGMVVYSDDPSEKTLIKELLEKYPLLREAGVPPRYGIVHRLDKDTSGIILIAKNNKSLTFLQKEFKLGKVEKKYLALAVGQLKNKKGSIETLIGRENKNRKKQKAYLSLSPQAKKEGLRKAITHYCVQNEYIGFSLLDITLQTGRKHQIRAHLAYLNHPIAGDKIYGFKNQPCPKNLNRQFLHSKYLKIKLPNGKIREFQSSLPENLQKILENLKFEK